MLFNPHLCSLYPPVYCTPQLGPFRNLGAKHITRETSLLPAPRVPGHCTAPPFTHSCSWETRGRHPGRLVSHTPCLAFVSMFSGTSASRQSDGCVPSQLPLSPITNVRLFLGHSAAFPDGSLVSQSCSIPFHSSRSNVTFLKFKSSRVTAPPQALSPVSLAAERSCSLLVLGRRVVLSDSIILSWPQLTAPHSSYV